MKKDLDDHGGKMLPCQSSGVRRMGRKGRESRVQRSSVQGREVLITIVIMLRKKPARGSTVAREHESTREREHESMRVLMHLPAPGLRGVGRSVPPCVRTSVQGLGRTREVCPCW